MIKTGVFIGSFNPPTISHFKIGHYLYDNKYLDRIVYVPVNSEKKDLINLKDRFMMLDNYLSKYSYFKTSDIMFKETKFNYLVLDKLKKEYTNITIIIGSDLLINLKTFDSYESILKNYNIIVIPRYDIDNQMIINTYYQKYANKFTIINYHNNISSKLVREYIKNNCDITNYVDKETLKFINTHNLYR